jgi:diguanylate cyclase (GGDEF)-like protein
MSGQDDMITLSAPVADRRENPEPQIDTFTPDAKAVNISRAAEVHSSLESLERAIEDEESWLHELFRAMLCRTQINMRELSEDAYLHSPFGRWYYSIADSVFTKNPLFRPIGNVHRLIRTEARRLEALTRDGQLISPAEFERFQKAIAEFRRNVRRLEQGIERQFAHLDPTTGVHRPEGMIAQLQIERERARRSNVPCVIALAQIEDYDELLADCGQAAADEAMQNLAVVFAGSLRPYDMLTRLMDDRFLFCLPGAQTTDAGSVFDRLRMQIASNLMEFEGGNLRALTIAVGVVELDVELPIEKVLEQVAKALLRAAQSDDDRVVTYDPAIDGRG